KITLNNYLKISNSKAENVKLSANMSGVTTQRRLRVAGFQRASGPLARNVCARACAMFAFSEQANLRFRLAEIWFLPPLLGA
ncbi:MAG: hypothetical protein IJW09_03510, partial [Clostridia bacterium]|nr:hypothetical protein [Clostridia bacterium]